MNISTSGGGSSGGIAAANGAVAISSGASTVSTTFTTAFANTSYALVVSIRNLVDATPIMLSAVSTAKSTTGFTVTFNAPTDSVNYFLEYLATGNV